MSSKFNLFSKTKKSDSGEDNKEAYVEIVLEIFDDDSVVIHSIQGKVVREDQELFSILNKALENRCSSQLGWFLFIWKHLSAYQEGLQRAETPNCFTN